MLYRQSSIVRTFLNLKTAFRRCVRGNISTIFAFSLVPIAAVAGAGVDYSRAVETRNQLQQASDAAALMGGRILSEDGKDYNIRARKSFNENAKNAIFAKKVKFDIKKIKEGVRVDVSAKMDTTFLAVIGYTSIDLAVFSEIGVSNTKLELALVLDNTGSMSGRKITTLKNSARDLVKAVMPKPGNNEQTRIAVVPFADYVNIGLKHRKEPGIDVRDDYSIKNVRPGGNWCRNTYPKSTRKCKWTGGSPGYWGTCTKTVVNDGVTSTKTYRCKKGASKGTKTCTGSRGKPVRKCTPYPPKVSYTKYKWYGCVGSRNPPLDTRDDTYSTRVPGLLAKRNNCKPRALTRLTENRNTVLKAIKAMRADGMTYIPTGLLWGWRTLSAGIPFADGEPYGKTRAERKKNRKVIVLMTDGMNTRSPTYPEHIGSNTGKANTLMTKICNNIKDKYITVYTIAFEVKDATVKKLLKDCVGNDGAYFDAKNAGELKLAFKNIALALMRLRLTK